MHSNDFLIKFWWNIELVTTISVNNSVRVYEPAQIIYEVDCIFPSINYKFPAVATDTFTEQ
jgi:hypothetical protein